MKTLAFTILALAGALALALTLTPGCSWLTPPPAARGNSSLASWVASVRQPGFVLLVEEQLPDYYICAFALPQSEVAFLYRWIGSDDEKPDTHSLLIRDASGRNLQDKKRWDLASPLPRGKNGEFYEGMVIPIDPSHKGALHLDFQVDRQSVYQKAVTPPEPGDPATGDRPK